MFGFGSSKDAQAHAAAAIVAQQAQIGAELTAIREGVTFVRTEIAALGQDLKGVRAEQGRHEEWLRRIDMDVQSMRRASDKLEDLETRVKAAETSLKDLSNWKTVEGAKWSGPQKAIAVIASIIPVALAFYGLVNWLTRATN
ncbi:hypothetical protein [Microcystis phage Mwe-JY26]